MVSLHVSAGFWDGGRFVLRSVGIIVSLNRRADGVRNFPAAPIHELRNQGGVMVMLKKISRKDEETLNSCMKII